MSPFRHPQRQAFASIFGLQTVSDAAVRGSGTAQTDRGSVDPITGLPDAQAFRRAFQGQAMVSLRTNAPLSLALIGLDDLALAARFHGRTVADQVFHVAAKQLRATFRASDFMARWREDELAVLFPDTNLTGTVRAVEKAVRALRSVVVPVPSGDAVEVSLCAGIVPAPPAAPFMDAVDFAARLLSIARAGGRGRVRWPDGELALLRTRILVISSTDAHLASTRSVFGADSVQHASARDASAAVAEAEAQVPAMIVIDVSDSEGWDTLARVRKSRILADVPILVLGTSRDQLARSFDLGADDFLTLPFALEELWARSQRFLKRRQVPAPEPPPLDEPLLRRIID